MPASKRILLLSVSAGAGHGRAAEALRAQAHSDGITAEHIDVMTLVPRSFRTLYTEYYIRLVEHHPSVWAYLYHAADKMPRDAMFAKFQRTVERLNTLKLRAALEQFAPEHIICTHFFRLSCWPTTANERGPYRRYGCRSRTSICTGCGCSRACAATSRPATRSPSAW